MLLTSTSNRGVLLIQKHSQAFDSKVSAIARLGIASSDCIYCGVREAQDIFIILYLLHRPLFILRKYPDPKDLSFAIGGG